MNLPEPLLSVTLPALLVATLCGCVAYRECGFSGCPGDATITANVEGRFARYPPLSANSVRIQTLNGVVYLTGQVDTDVERLLAVSVASDVTDVSRVVDSISVNNVGR